MDGGEVEFFLFAKTANPNPQIFLEYKWLSGMGESFIK